MEGDWDGEVWMQDYPCQFDYGREKCGKPAYGTRDGKAMCKDHLDYYVGMTGLYEGIDN